MIDIMKDMGKVLQNVNDMYRSGSNLDLLSGIHTSLAKYGSTKEFDELQNTFGIKEWKDLVNLQDLLNSKINSTWKTQDIKLWRGVNFKFYELLDKEEWKWWRKYKNDETSKIIKMIDIKIILIDIFNYLLSIAIKENKTDPMYLFLISIYKMQEKEKQLKKSKEEINIQFSPSSMIKNYDNLYNKKINFFDKIENEIILMSQMKVFDIVSIKYFELIKDIKMNVHEFKVLFFIRNIINDLRLQDNYNKIWNSKKDIHRAIELILMQEKDFEEIDYKFIRKTLHDEYKKIINITKNQ